VGAFALAVHGFPRATDDRDLLVRPPPDNASRVLRALSAFGAPIDAHGVRPEDLAREGTVYQLRLPSRRIDLLTSISGVSFADASAETVTGHIGRTPVRFIGLEALICNNATSAPRVGRRTSRTPSSSRRAAPRADPSLSWTPSCPVTRPRRRPARRRGRGPARRVLGSGASERARSTRVAARDRPRSSNGVAPVRPAYSSAPRTTVGTTSSGPGSTSKANDSASPRPQSDATSIEPSPTGRSSTRRPSCR